MMKPYPTYRQREVLQLLMQGDWVPILKMIPLGTNCLATLYRRAGLNGVQTSRQVISIASLRRDEPPIRHLSR
jgi:hypothetical protein